MEITDFGMTVLPSPRLPNVAEPLLQGDFAKGPIRQLKNLGTPIALKLA